MSRLAKPARALFGVALGATVLLAPSQRSISLAGAHVTPADLLLLACVPLAALALWTRPRERDAPGQSPLRPFPPDLPYGALFLALALLSALLSGHLKTGLVEWAQFLLYFGFGGFAGWAAIRVGGHAWIRRGIVLFLAGGAANVAVALAQYLGPMAEVGVEGKGIDAPSFEVRGLFTNRNVLGGYLAMLLPFAFGLLARRREQVPRDEASDVPTAAPAAGAMVIGGKDGPTAIWLSSRAGRALFDAALVLLLCAGFTVALSGAGLFAATLAVLVFAVLRGPAWGVATASVLLAGFLLLAPETPRDNFTTPLRSIELFDAETGAPARRYTQWQAALAMTFEQPWRGLGPGTYQRNVGAFYDVVPRETGHSEDDIQNLYLVLAATCGWPALLAFCAMLLCAAAAPFRLPAKGRPPCASAASAALLGFAVAAIWNPLLVRGIGIPLVFLLTLAPCTSSTSFPSSRPAPSSRLRKSAASDARPVSAGSR